MKNTFKYEINETVIFDQGNMKWDLRGEGKVLMQQEYLSCNAYLVEMPDGIKTQVREDQISGNK
ncbi:hypothetical protein [Salmonella phage SSBI34]|nr:hypothetical protein [Salmonella phage SSBI34]